tara:strand:+ start:436 stop:630 length:195 start_codon:yes stop_codon:yes gene_type:complete
MYDDKFLTALSLKGSLIAIDKARYEIQNRLDDMLKGFTIAQLRDYHSVADGLEQKPEKVNSWDG